MAVGRCLGSRLTQKGDTPEAYEAFEEELEDF
jgi:hypothetical protein